MKKLINNVNDIVTEMLDGITLSYGDIVKRLGDLNVVTRTNIDKSKVALVSGGGSGHEPAHAGYVGTGMLSAAVAGEVFTSPTPDQILEAIQATAGEAGALMVIKNYTGDILNFEMAADMADAMGIPCKKVVVNDDIALENSTYTTGKRGIAGTVFVHKIAGAKAESGASLDEVQKTAQKVIDNVASIGMSLGPCIVPASGKASFELGPNEVEIGLGIHGEPGIKRSKLLTADEHTTDLMSRVMKSLKLKSGDRVALLVNGLGGTPEMELFIIARKAIQILQAKKIGVAHTKVGQFMTAIEMPGFSLTLLKVDNELESLLKAPCKTVGWGA